MRGLRWRSYQVEAASARRGLQRFLDAGLDAGGRALVDQVTALLVVVWIDVTASEALVEQVMCALRRRLLRRFGLRVPASPVRSRPDGDAEQSHPEERPEHDQRPVPSGHVVAIHACSVPGVPAPRGGMTAYPCGGKAAA